MTSAPLPKLVSIHAPKINCNQLSMNTFTEVLQSESVKRLLNKQNVYLQTPLSDGSIASDLASSRNSLEKHNGSLDNASTEKVPELSVIPIMSLSEKGSTPSNNDDIHLLPSKHAGKSAVALLPIRWEKRHCGHFEPCESLICEVEFQRLADGVSVLPLIAVNIETDEIDAPVFKHCKKEHCDALSIDHDRCRRAIVRCYRCDQTKICDICLVVLKTRKSQMMHKNCKMRIEYRHNKTSRGQLMRDRMRERELQILESAKLNKNDYTDPMTGHERAMESLQKNSELIIIPKATPPTQQHPTIRITSVSGAAMPSSVYAGKILGKFLSPLVFPAQRMILGKRTSTESTDYQSVGKLTKLVNLTSGTSSQGNQIMSIARAGNVGQTLNVSGFLQSQSQKNSPSQGTSYFMPIRVVPIAGLKTEPSLLHQTQGVPKFCIVSQSPSQSSSTSSSSQFTKAPTKILPAQQRVRAKNEASRIARKNETSAEFVLKRFKPGMRRGRRKKNGPKRGSKSFECTFCFKRFSTDWYFKLHIAKHKGEIKFTCKYCKKPFMHLYNMQKHIVTMHKENDGSDVTFGDEDIDENQEFMDCSSCGVTFESLSELELHRCHVACLRCHSRFTEGDLMLHLRTKHEFSEQKALEEFERQKRQRAIMVQNRGRKKRENEQQQVRGTRTKEDMRDKRAGNGSPTRKRSSILANDRRTRDDSSNDQTANRTTMRRLTRRKNHSISDRLETVSSNENYEGTSELDTTELISR